MRLVTSTRLVAGGLKRLCDTVLSLAALVFLCPLLLVVAAAVLIDSGRPVFFLQERVGLRGRLFRIIKFRTMTRDAESRTARMQVDGSNPLVTRLGRFLRRTKIDELPQLFNVLHGDMSLIGPRPVPPAQAARYSARERERLNMRPGMTGLAQVNGNVALSWDERIAYDLLYIETWSLKLDISILLRTIGVVLMGEEHFRHPLGG